MSFEKPEKPTFKTTPPTGLKKEYPRVLVKIPRPTWEK